MATDIQTLIGEIAARNHIRIEDSDPIFAVCTINRLMMDEAFEALMVRVRAAIGEFEASARSVDAHAGKMLADQVRMSASAVERWRSRTITSVADVRSTEMIERSSIWRTPSRPCYAGPRWASLRACFSYRMRYLVRNFHVR